MDRVLNVSCSNRYLWEGFRLLIHKFLSPSRRLRIRCVRSRSVTGERRQKSRCFILFIDLKEVVNTSTLHYCLQLSNCDTDKTPFSRREWDYPHKRTEVWSLSFRWESSKGSWRLPVLLGETPKHLKRFLLPLVFSRDESWRGHSITVHLLPNKRI